MLVLAFSCSCERKTNQEQLGEIKLEVSGHKDALPYFEKGMLLLHSFEYHDAEENFRKAKEIDPEFTMAYWGEAMTHNHSLWRFQDYKKGQLILNSLGFTPHSRSCKGNNEFEKDLINAVNILYGEGSKIERDSAYAAFMGELYLKYPGNDEIASLYSVSLIGSVPVGRDDQVYGKAADIAKEVLERNPRHPGALHYLIHAYDDPDHASLALATADSYSKVAPSAAHALHMPTHIYLALGVWDKVISSNEMSWAASVQRKDRKNLDNDALGFHSFHWLLYGYLQKENKTRAREMVEEMNQYCQELPSGRARAHLMMTKSTYLIDSEDWDPEIVDIEVDKTRINIATRAMHHFANGMYAYKNNNIDSLAAVIKQLTTERLIDKELISPTGISMCSGVNYSMPNALDLQQAEVMELELKALLARSNGDENLAEDLFKQATALENGISYAYGPPVIVKPSNELYGEWLLEFNRPAEALQQFELSLKAAPNRLLSVKGKEKAQKLMDEISLARN
ncbi:hypothetical protein BH23BAC1_BH23BAC1_17040 [soil metagenome]